MKKKTYKIRGMHCASCAGTIERVLLKAAGVRSASANFASESALIEFDENVVSEAGLAKAVESVGYHLEIGSQLEVGSQEKSIPTQAGADEKEKGEAAASGNIEIISIKVLGMDSPHCAMTVQGALKKLPGI